MESSGQNSNISNFKLNSYSNKSESNKSNSQAHSISCFNDDDLKEVYSFEELRKKAKIYLKDNPNDYVKAIEIFDIDEKINY